VNTKKILAVVEKPRVALI